jgi:hypothetical protein
MPEQRCAECGTPRKDDLQVCVTCEAPFPVDDAEIDAALPRPAAPSPTQSHGTLMAALLVGFVVLAVLLGLSVRNVGPFRVTVDGSVPSGDTTRLTITVSNDGSKPGHGNCRVGRISDQGDQRPEWPFLSQRVPGKSSVTQTIDVPVEPGVRTAQVACR